MGGVSDDAVSWQESYRLHFLTSPILGSIYL